MAGFDSFQTVAGSGNSIAGNIEAYAGRAYKFRAQMVADSSIAYAGNVLAYAGIFSDQFYIRSILEQISIISSIDQIKSHLRSILNNINIFSTPIPAATRIRNSFNRVNIHSVAFYPREVLEVLLKLIFGNPAIEIDLNGNPQISTLINGSPKIVLLLDSGFIIDISGEFDEVLLISGNPEIEIDFAGLTENLEPVGAA